MNPENESEALLQELRADLPGPERAERIRARLIAAGVAVGTVVSGTTSAAAATGAAALGAAAKAGGNGAGSALWASWSGLSLGAKVAVSVAIGASAGAGPIWLWHDSASSPVATAAQTTTLQAPTGAGAAAERRRAPEGPSNPAEPRLDEPLALPSSENGEPTARSHSTLGSKAQDGAAAIAARATATPIARSNPEPAPAVRAEEAPDDIEPMHAPPAASFEPPPVLLEAPVAPEPGRAPATLGEETVLIDRAFAALRAGAFARAEALLAEHQRRFPAGDLVRERERARAKLAQAVQARAYE